MSAIERRRLMQLPVQIASRRRPLSPNFGRTSTSPFRMPTFHIIIEQVSPQDDMYSTVRLNGKHSTTLFSPLQKSAEKRLFAANGNKCVKSCHMGVSPRSNKVLSSTLCSIVRRLSSKNTCMSPSLLSRETLPTPRINNTAPWLSQWTQQIQAGTRASTHSWPVYYQQFYYYRTNSPSDLSGLIGPCC